MEIGSLLDTDTAFDTAFSVVTVRCLILNRFQYTVLFVCNFVSPLAFPAITCGHPGNPTFGMTQGTQFNLNDAVRFVCNTGYVLQGAVKSACQANGQWSNALPRCKSKCQLDAKAYQSVYP